MARKGFSGGPVSDGRVFDSFRSLGIAMGFSAPVSDLPRSKRCKVCSSPMVNIPGTNVWVCHGKTEKGEACTNRTTSRI